MYKKKVYNGVKKNIFTTSAILYNIRPFDVLKSSKEVCFLYFFGGFNHRKNTQLIRNI